jgi:hypothetical protein
MAQLSENVTKRIGLPTIEAPNATPGPRGKPFPPKRPAAPKDRIGGRRGDQRRSPDIGHGCKPLTGGKSW